MQRTSMLLTVAATLVGAVFAHAQDRRSPVTPAGTPAPAIDYERDVRPILTQCFACHGPRKAQSGLRLDLRQNALRGGDYGVVIVPGRSADSKLIKRLTGSTLGIQMPPTGPLPAVRTVRIRPGSGRRWRSPLRCSHPWTGVLTS